MNPVIRGAGKVLGMSSGRAANYLSKGSKNAAKINAKASQAATLAASMGITGPKASAHNLAIRGRQRQLAMRYGIGAAGVAAVGTQGKNRSSYRPPSPMTQAPSGSGRFA